LLAHPTRPYKRHWLQRNHFTLLMRVDRITAMLVFAIALAN
jgi:hypothetical protein